MTSRGLAWFAGVLTVASLVLSARPVQGQYTGATSYPYWGSAPSGYRGETWADRALGQPYGVFPSPSYLSPSLSPVYGVGSSAGASAFGGYMPFSYSNNYALLPGSHLTLPRNTATIRLHVPAGARVWFDGEPTQQKGTERVFHSPPLVPGKRYRYEIRAEWTKNGKRVEEKRNVQVRANAEAEADLTRPASR
jgi:uncharacterized protein (TIGR03000 family)